MNAGASIRFAFTRAATLWASGLLAVLATFAEVFAGVIATLAVIAWLEGHEKSPPVALGAAVACALAARILLALVQGGAIRQSARAILGQASASTFEEILAASPRSLGWFAWTLPVEILAVAWRWLGTAALVWAYLRAFVHKAGGASASAALAMFIVLSLPLALGWALLRRAALVHAVADGSGPFRAAAAAVAHLGTRPLSYLAVWITGVAGASVAEMMLSLFASAVSAPDPLRVEPMLAEQLAVGLLVSFVVALFELTILHGFTALTVAPPAPPAPAAPPPEPVAPVAAVVT